MTSWSGSPSISRLSSASSKHTSEFMLSLEDCCIKELREIRPLPPPGIGLPVAVKVAPEALDVPESRTVSEPPGTLTFEFLFEALDLAMMFLMNFEILLFSLRALSWPFWTESSAFVGSLCLS